MDIVSWTLTAKESEYDQDKPLYIDPTDPERCLSANKTRTLVRQLASGFKDHGLGKGDCVCIISFNDIHYTSLYLGIIGSGGCFTGANPGYTVHELVHHIRTTETKYLLAEPKVLDSTIAAAKECSIPHSNIFVLNFRGEEVPTGHQSWSELLNCGESDWVRVEDPDHTPAAYVSTSGTSGLPKAAIIPHSYLVSQGEYQERISTVSYQISNLITIPPFHVFTIPLQHAGPLRKGTPTYIMPRFEERIFVDALEKYHITQTAVVPPIMMVLSNCADAWKLNSLRRIFVAGSCATDGMQQQLYAKISKEARIEQVYGMTEAGWATNWQHAQKDATGSIGQPLPGVELRLVDRDGNVIVNDCVSGEIEINTPHPMKGYLNNASADTEAFTTDGWIRSGDVGYVKDASWYVIDRTKDLIKVRGWQVSPAEIEAALLDHANIADAAVIGIPALDGTGEAPVAFVVRKEGSKLEEKEVKEFLGGRLARYKRVEEVTFIDRVPRNPTGKILRRVLRDARGSRPLSPSQAAASAYSNAIRDLSDYQKRRNSDNSWSGHSRAGSLTDAETIETPSVITPPSDEIGPLWEDRSKKRRNEDGQPPAVKRRSPRIARVVAHNAE